MKTPFTEREVEILARISALEYLVAQLFNMQYGKEGLTISQIKEEHRKAKALMKRQTIPGLDAAQSDMFSGEMESALADVLETAEALFERYSQIGKSPQNSK
jgi:hypothetical protein